MEIFPRDFGFEERMVGEEELQDVIIPCIYRL